MFINFERHPFFGGCEYIDQESDARVWGYYEVSGEFEGDCRNWNVRVGTLFAEGFPTSNAARNFVEAYLGN